MLHPDTFQELAPRAQMSLDSFVLLYRKSGASDSG
jgi:hypothetical protein